MSRMEDVANVALRVPNIVLLDLLYRWDVESFTQLLRPKYEESIFKSRYVWNIYYLGHVLCVVLLMLPVRYLVKMYLYLLTVLLLYVAHQTSRDYIRREIESEYQGAVYRDPIALNRIVTALTGELLQLGIHSPQHPSLQRDRHCILWGKRQRQVIVSTLCSFLMKTRQVWLFSAPLLPLLARLCGFPLQSLPVVNTFATILTSLEVLYVVATNLFVPLHLAKTACREVAQVLEVYRLVALVMSLWNQLSIPLLFLVFWLVLFSLQIYSLASRTSLLDRQGLLFVFLSRSPWKHFRGISMCVFLLIFPCFMAYKISHFFHMDFWLLILVSSCMLTSLQVMGTLFIYSLFMVELFQGSPLEKMDEIIYCVNAVSRVLEFLVAVCVVGYGTWESLFGEWSWMGASVIIIHSYFNVWLRAQSGWKSFLLRREAAKKINLLPRASRGQLQAHNDICSICFQEMNVAVITSCGHFFHSGCLRKWLYVQDTCPMCHQQVAPSSPEADGAGLQTAEEGGEEEQAAAEEAQDPGGETDTENTVTMDTEVPAPGSIQTFCSLCLSPAGSETGYSNHTLTEGTGASAGNKMPSRGTLCAVHREAAGSDPAPALDGTALLLEQETDVLPSGDSQNLL
ncbi:RING finger protein 145-like isoform X5 [Rhinatrema bivittatum]|uniref:RING finger protein 145-like isoform X5 n=1 Tax=Rhinatrema bivittatum TaxID=194408 RepID=UPI00112C0F91|nr:RING finger protein 145-like isoform X5 [Rhinatrema bivittatum]